ncbi:MAG: AAA family ATPase, partial [Deltaproteobacteria bacterium]|nr:AAA family ATPase [Deltaproteobacteria bacterium]
MRKTNIILTGFMGTGKSTLGRLLAKRLGYEFIDTDTEIEKRIGQTIAELFQEQGEGVFRQYEAELVQELAQQQGLVIATGGGL